MRWISGSVCAALVGGVAASVAFGTAAGAATPYDFCDKSYDNRTGTETVTCSFDSAGAHSVLVPRIATSVRLTGIGGHGSKNASGGYGQNAAAYISAVVPDALVDGHTLSVVVGGDAARSAGGANGGADGGSSFAGGGGGASTISDGTTPLLVVPGSGGGGDMGINESFGATVNGGKGGTVLTAATKGDGSPTSTEAEGGEPGRTGDNGGAGGAGGGFPDLDGGPDFPSGNPGEPGTATAGGKGGNGVVATQTSNVCPSYSAGGGGGGGYGGGGGGGAGAAQSGGDEDCGGGGGGASGGYYVTPDYVGVVNFYDTSASASVSISWNQRLTLTSGDAPDGAVGQPYSFQFTSDVPNSTFRIVSGATPAGLTLSRAGLLSGTPTTKASYGFTVEVTDPDRAAQRTAVQSVTIDSAVTAPVTFTNGAPPQGTVGQPYSFAFSAESCPGCVFRRTAGGFPPGLTLATSGVLSGTPTGAGKYSVTVTATDNTGRSASQSTTVRTIATSTLRVNDVSVTEASGTAKFTVSLSPSRSSTVTAKYATANGTAVQPGDYTKATGTLTFTAGQTSKTVSVPIINDTAHEAAEKFTLVLSGASGAGIADVSGTATIAASD